MVTSETYIRDFSQRIFGIFKVLDDGLRLLLSFPGRQIPGRYWPKDGATRDFSSPIVGRANILMSPLD